MIAVAAIAPAVARFYGVPQLGPITVVSAVSFPIGALAVQHAALLRRQMRFGELAKTDVVGLAVGVATTTFLAWRGAQYWALVVGRLAEGLSVTAALWLLSRWRPGLPVRHAGIRSMLSFGGNLTGFTVTNYFARNLDNLLIGRFWGAEQLGLYSKAYQLLLLPIRQINAPLSAVSVPALSALADDSERYRQAYLRILEKIAIITMPGMAFAMATADWLVLIVLGPRWVEVAKIFAVLAASALAQPVANTAGWLFVSQDRSRDMLRWGIVGSTLIVLGIVAGLPWGVVGVAASYSATTLGLAIPLLFWFVGRRGPVRAQDLYRATAPAFVASMAVLGTLVGVRRLLADVAPMTGLAVSLGCTVLVACLTLSASSAGRHALRDLALAIRLVLENRRRGGSTR